MFKLVTAPTNEPVSLAEMKLHLRVDHSAEDDLINSLIKAARMQGEAFTNMSFFTTTWTYSLNSLPIDFVVNKHPIRSLSIKYYDLSNTEQILSSELYDLDTISVPARIRKGWNKTYPQVYNRLNAVNIEITAGYLSTSLIPDDIKAAIKLLVGHLYENRQSVVVGHQVNELPQAVEFLLIKYRSFVWS